MSQNMVPNADITTGGWTPTPLFQQIDFFGGTTDSISSPASIGSFDCEVALSNVSPPGIATGHFVRVAARDVANSGGSVALTIKVMDGATELQSFVHTLPTGSFDLDSFAWTNPPGGGSGSYADIRLRFIAVADDGRKAEIAYADILVPDPGFEHLDIDPPGLTLAAADSGNYLVPDGPGLKRKSGREADESLPVLVLNPDGTIGVS